MQKLQISIPEPCHESWHHMTPTQQGRFCTACAKEVVDFSMMSDRELIQYFSKLSNEKVCGRALPTQLNRTISMPVEPKKRLFWYWNYIVMFFMMFSKSNAVKAQGGIKPVTEINPVKPACESKGDAAIASRVVTGNVTDVDGNPVSFATIRIKGANTGLSADANGRYYIRVHPGCNLLISGASFKEAEVPVGNKDTLNTVLEKGGQCFGGEVLVVVGGMGYRDGMTYSDPKYTAAIRVKDEGSSLPIGKARISIIKRYSNEADTVFTDSKGRYKLRSIKEYDHLYVKIEAEGYEGNEFEISGSEFSGKNRDWDVLLRRKEIKRTTEAVITVGQVSLCKLEKEPLYIVDEVIQPGKPYINPDDIENYTVVPAPEATAIYGIEGSAGAVLITTRKAKVMTLTNVVVSSSYAIRRTTPATGMISFAEKRSVFSEVSTSLRTLFADSLKVYPNPVERGNTFSVYLKLKQTGNHIIQVADAAGRIIAQEPFNAVAKEHKENVHAWLRWAAGIYYIRVFDNRNQLVSKTSFIVQ